MCTYNFEGSGCNRTNFTRGRGSRLGW